jgi:hypothetical protein
VSALQSAPSDQVVAIEERPLYKLLMRGLPSFHKQRVAGSARLDIREIAKEIGVTPQGIYKRFEPGATQNTIKVGMARKLVELSNAESNKIDVPDGFVPLTMEDFTPFLT